jgi:two-component system, NtrC family, nitrogen regulation sensor histidine kinase NtrY
MNIRKHLLVIISIVLMLMGIIVSRYSDQLANPARYVERAKQTLSVKCEKAESYFNKLLHYHEEQVPDLIEAADRDGIILLMYTSDSLVFWSSNSIPGYEVYPEKLFSSRIVKIFNSFYYVKKQQINKKVLIGLINIKYRYPYENDFLHSAYNPDFRLPDGATLSQKQGEGYDVFDTDNQFLFGIIVPKTENILSPRTLVAYLLIFLGCILFAVYLFRLIKLKENERVRIFIALITILLLAGARLVQLLLGFNFRGIALFDPYLFADSVWVPSLGDLFINSLILLYSAILIVHFFNFPNLRKSERLRKNALVQLCFLSVYSAFFNYAHYFSKSLIYNSNISFQPNELDQLSLYTLGGVFINGMNYFSAGLIMVWWIRLLSAEKDLIRNIRISVLGGGLIFTLLFLWGYPIDAITILYFFIFTFHFIFLYYKRIEVYRYSVWILIILFFSLYQVAFLVQQSGIKEDRVRSTLALGLADEHDPIAEYLLDELSSKIEADSAVHDSVTAREVNISNLRDFLKRNYFKGYWNKYDLQVTICSPIDSVVIQIPDYQMLHCYDFFGSIIRDVGLALPNTKFYYLDDQTGRVSYLGKYGYKIEEFPFEVNLFIELDSKLSNEFLGYPELLLDKKLQTDRLINQYSYAKYHLKNLIARHGDFNYSLNSKSFGDSPERFRIVKLEGYKHLLYRSGKDNLIVLSLPAIRFIDLLIGFSYVFLFFFLCLMLAFAARNLTRTEFQLLTNLRSKIQISIISVLLISMLLIAASTIWFSILNYRNSQEKLLHEKVQSILVELTRRLGNQPDLSPEWNGRRYDNLNQLLIRYSDAFFTDINLYYPSGDLLATSRYEIFQMGLQGDKMDPVALYKMKIEKRAQFIHREKIGDMSYQSAYVPFLNTNGKLLAYLNLPYFTKQSELQAALSTLIVTIINIYVILIIITIVLTVFITNQITRPLNLLQQRFRQLKLGNRYEQINYGRKDEIGNLVTEYNKMVIELEKSIELLAKSERESAWREMAKQIAHEIKNPLTPMRLSVQQLQKLWKEKREDYDKYLGSVTATLIEQIDNLSAIATEFSNFAKMPAARLEMVDLVTLLSKTVELYKGSETYTIQFKSTEETIPIKADKEQLSRVFMNLIRNAVQSVPDSRKGKIVLELSKHDELAVLSVSDNGKGISEEIRPRLFTPNFTTKSGGMGMGLAIVKNILEEMGASISFTTKPGKGTVFSIEFTLPS